VEPNGADEAGAEPVDGAEPPFVSCE